MRGRQRSLAQVRIPADSSGAAGRPGTGGGSPVNFTIIAEPDVGGLVSESAINDEKSTIADAQLRECVQETMYGAHFPAPLDGGEVRVTYPFEFASAK